MTNPTVSQFQLSIRLEMYLEEEIRGQLLRQIRPNFVIPNESARLDLRGSYD